MNWVDFLIIALLLYTIWQGVIRGWVAALVGIIIMAASWLVTILLLPYYGPGVESLPLEAAWARTIAFGVILIRFCVLRGIAVAMAILGLRAGELRVALALVLERHVAERLQGHGLHCRTMQRFP